MRRMDTICEELRGLRHKGTGISEVTEKINSTNEKLAALVSTVNRLTKLIETSIDGGTKIPVSNRDRAISLLRKELISKNGGGVKVEEYKKLLVQAKIGSSYMQDAINELNCKKMLANNGIQYIVPNEA